MSESPQYSPRLDEAIALATDAFRPVIRKGSGVPYLTHLLQVLVTVGEHFGDEDQMIAAVLHDYLEDIESGTGEELESKFGPRVRRLVEALSDTTVLPKPPWKERKVEYLAHLQEAPAEVKLISAADKLHNALSILRDHRAVGEAIWDRFTAPKEETLWYYASVVTSLSADWQHPLLDELRGNVEALHQLR
ncbi:MAG: (p)ppGpp synthase/HD superfamily hydrolase [Polyangiales bacterium]|jgi:(p)ppGpp synthase/HD superfamily hydrolase